MRTASSFFANFGFFLTLTSSFAFAGESAVSLMNAGMASTCAEYAQNVSKSEGNFSSVSPVVNGVTCYGAFQFCSAKGRTDGGTFGRYYKGTPQQFLDDPSAQINAWLSYQRNEWSAAQQNGMTSALGKEVCYNGTCATITQSSVLKACQFGCGKGGKLDNLVRSGMNCNAPGTADGAGTSVCRYLVSGAGYDVSCITNSSDGTNCIAPGIRS
ncbi:acyltransferase [Phyllobacterium brassicacearum]|uniref:Acyltransferase n=1 Tax=Phyllobacterium brassicacearum TaxID=314235 RepID=A0A2P7BA43_9HYPH|nr:acyltransferase [Phyllobacterium brassicacearum]PSH63335.1 acyltransferase [Phyllobacterium brassicacearum]TDQ18185.1 hypothetical protein DEV91_12548 [Phyllobacterium brassicacearum]